MKHKNEFFVEVKVIEKSSGKVETTLMPWRKFMDSINLELEIEHQKENPDLDKVKTIMDMLDSGLEQLEKMKIQYRSGLRN